MRHVDIDFAQRYRRLEDNVQHGAAFGLGRARVEPTRLGAKDAVPAEDQLALLEADLVGDRVVLLL